MSNSETLKKINRAKKLLKDALDLLENLEKPNGTLCNGIDCPPSKKEASTYRNRRDFL